MMDVEKSLPILSVYHWHQSAIYDEISITKLTAISILTKEPINEQREFLILKGLIKHRTY